MSDMEYRALLEYHAAQLIHVTQEPRLGYGLVPAQHIIDRIQRMLLLAKELEPS